MSPELLQALRRRASDLLAGELAEASGGDDAGASGDDWHRRARDYRSWQLMRSYPERVRRLARAALAAPGASSPPPDGGGFHEACLALTGVLAELCEEAAQRRQSGQ